MSNGEAAERIYTDEVTRLYEVFTSVLKKLKQANTSTKVYSTAIELYEDLEMSDYPPSLVSQEIIGHLSGLEREIEDVESEREEGQLNGQRAEEHKRVMILHLTALIASMQTIIANKDAAAIMRTEKEFLSEKLPKDVADNVASFVTGKKGTLGAQISQLAVDRGRPGVSSRKGGKKTKKNRTKRRKTHGRRV